MEYIKNDSYVFPLDLRGKQHTSEEFSNKGMLGEREGVLLF